MIVAVGSASARKVRFCSTAGKVAAQMLGYASELKKVDQICLGRFLEDEILRCSRRLTSSIAETLQASDLYKRMVDDSESWYVQ